jgi:hypothetical protein
VKNINNILTLNKKIDLVFKIQIFISIAISALFFIAGFNFSSYLNVQSPNSQYAQVGSILGGIGAASSMLNLVRLWLLEDSI